MFKEKHMGNPERFSIFQWINVVLVISYICWIYLLMFVISPFHRYPVFPLYHYTIWQFFFSSQLVLVLHVKSYTFYINGIFQVNYLNWFINTFPMMNLCCLTLNILKCGVLVTLPSWEVCTFLSLNSSQYSLNEAERIWLDQKKKNIIDSTLYHFGPVQWWAA